MVIDKLNMLLEEYKYKYYKFGFEFDSNIVNDIKISNMRGVFIGKYGTLVNVVTTIYDDIIYVSGQLKLLHDITFDDYGMDINDIVLSIYNENLYEKFLIKILNNDVRFLKDNDIYM